MPRKPSKSKLWVELFQEVCQSINPDYLILYVDKKQPDFLYLYEEQQTSKNSDFTLVITNKIYLESIVIKCKRYIFKF